MSVTPERARSPSSASFDSADDPLGAPAVTGKLQAHTVTVEKPVRSDSMGSDEYYKLGEDDEFPGEIRFSRDNAFRSCSNEPAFSKTRSFRNIMIATAVIAFVVIAASIIIFTPVGLISASALTAKVLTISGATIGGVVLTSAVALPCIYARNRDKMYAHFQDLDAYLDCDDEFIPRLKFVVEHQDYFQLTCEDVGWILDLYLEKGGENPATLRTLVNMMYARDGEMTIDIMGEKVMEFHEASSPVASVLFSASARFLRPGTYVAFILENRIERFHGQLDRCHTATAIFNLLTDAKNTPSHAVGLEKCMLGALDKLIQVDPTFKDTKTLDLWFKVYFKGVSKLETGVKAIQNGIERLPRNKRVAKARLQAALAPYRQSLEKLKSDSAKLSVDQRNILMRNADYLRQTEGE